jgi:hypothetical protein
MAQSPGAADDGRWLAEPTATADSWWIVEPTAAVVGPPERETFAGSAASGGAAVDGSEDQAKEDKKMTCDCDQNLSGCDLKIVSYSVVSVDPEIDLDSERIILPSHTIATSADMTPADFTAFVIASLRGENREKLERYDPEYLRVCFRVICHYPLPCLDYEKEQAQALRAINRTLREKERGHHLPPGSSHELAPTEPKKGMR